MDRHDYAEPDLLLGAESRMVRICRDGRCTAHDRLGELGRYAQGMWAGLRDVADLLREQARSSSAAWTDDEWDHWQRVYANTLDLLAGPHGDSGYGGQEATIVRQNVRQGR